MKRNLFLCILPLLMTISYTQCVNAQPYNTKQLSDNDLFQIGVNHYKNNKYIHASVYLYAYLQRNPLKLNDSSFRVKFYDVLNYSLVNNSKDADAAGVDAKADGSSSEGGADTHNGVTKPRAPSIAENVTIQIQSFNYWSCNDEGNYYIRQLGNEVWWYGESSDSGRAWSNVFHGTLGGDKIYGRWSDVPRGNSGRSGEMTLQILDQKRLKVIKKTGGFGGSEWIAVSP